VNLTKTLNHLKEQNEALLNEKLIIISLDEKQVA